jgi:glycerate kinase
VEVLEEGLGRLASVLGRKELTLAAGSGAGGGLGFAALLLGATRVPGATYLLDLLDFDSHLSGCDVLVTGEGALDAQSLSGKLPVAVAERAHAVGIPTIAVVGTCRLSADEWAGAGFDQVHALDALDPRCASDPELSLALLRGIGQALANPSS